MNVLRPMCRNITHSSKTNLKGLEVLHLVAVFIISMNVVRQIIKGGFVPVTPPPMLGSGLLASLLPSVAHLPLSRGSPLHPPSYIVKSYREHLVFGGVSKTSYPQILN